MQRQPESPCAWGTSWHGASVTPSYFIFARVVEYIRSFGTHQTPRENFERAFGITLDDFEREILVHLKSLIP